MSRETKYTWQVIRKPAAHAYRRRGAAAPDNPAFLSENAQKKARAQQLLRLSNSNLKCAIRGSNPGHPD